MKEEIKKRWVEALRSGKYKQTQRWLRDTKGFCCLGVLCDLYRKETTRIKWTKSISTCGDMHYTLETGFGSTSAELPMMIAVWAGLDYQDPIVSMPGKPHKVALTELNDHELLSFDEIANIIDKQL